MKKVLLALLSLVLMLTLCQCGKGGSSGETGEAPTPPEGNAIPYSENLETLGDKEGADAFERGLDHADSKYYVLNDYYNMESGGSLHILSQFQTYQQTTEYSCGCAAALMVLNRFGIQDYNEMDLCELLATDTSKGTSVENLLAFFASLDWTVDFHADTDYRFSSPEECRDYFIEKLDNGIPVMVDWVDWAGHWQVLIGLDTCGTDSPYDDVLILADPYDVTDHYQDGYYIFPLGRFFDMWREGPCTQKTDPYKQPFVVASPGNVDG